VRRQLLATAAAIGAALVLSAGLPAADATVSGRLQIVEKGGRQASDMSEAVLWIDGVKAKPQPGKAVVTMKGKQFIPRVVAVGVGSTVEFPNEDPIFHNVFSVSGENRFDLQLYKRPKRGAQTFTRPGIVRVYCNIHPQMSAIVVVSDSPYYARAAKDGSFTIEDVPPGSYTLRAWHERGGETGLPVNVGPGGASGLRLTLDGSAYKRQQHKRKDGSNYDRREKY